MTHTQNYNLTQWSPTDRILRSDFNADNAAIDTALADHAAQLAKLPKLGDCQIYTRTYTGTGTYGASNAITLTFPYPPMLVIVTGNNGFFMIMVRGCPAAVFPTSSPPTREAFLTWRNNSISWYGETDSGHINDKNRSYFVAALCSKA